MTTLGERVRQIRADMGLTQSAFSEKIGLKQNSIALIESGARNTTEPVLRAICREFNVSYIWLTEGIEPMRPPQSDSDIELITRAMEGENENKKKLIRIMADMPDELLDKMLEYLEGKLGDR